MLQMQHTVHFSVGHWQSLTVYCNSAFRLGPPPSLVMPGSYSNRMYCVEHYTSELFYCSLSRKPALSIISQPLGEKEMKGRTGVMMMLVPYSCYLCFWLILVGVGGGILLSEISLAKQCSLPRSNHKLQL